MDLTKTSELTFRTNHYPQDYRERMTQKFAVCSELKVTEVTVDNPLMHEFQLVLTKKLSETSGPFEPTVVTWH